MKIEDRCEELPERCTGRDETMGEYTDVAQRVLARKTRQSEASDRSSALTQAMSLMVGETNFALAMEYLVAVMLHPETCTIGKDPRQEAVIYMESLFAEITSHKGTKKGIPHVIFSDGTMLKKSTYKHAIQQSSAYNVGMPAPRIL